MTIQKRVCMKLICGILVVIVMLSAATPCFAAETDGAQIELTQEERDFVASCGVIKVGQVVRSPFCTIDESTGELTGMFVDICDLIARKSGLEFEHEALGVAVRGVDWLAETDGRIVAGLMDSAVSSPSPKLQLSDEAFHSTVVLVGRSGEQFDPDANMTMAIPKGFIGGEDYVKRTYPSFHILTVDDMNAALDAIAAKKADVVLQNIYVAREALQSVRYENLEIYPAYEVYDNMKLGVAGDEDPLLLSVINKAIASITNDEYNEIIMRYTVAKPYKITFSDTLYKLRTPLIIITILVILVIALLVAFIINRQKSLRHITEKNKLLAEAVEQTQLASQAKGDFLARMSHEIRTPMNAIIGLTTLAEDHTTEPEVVTQYLDKIESSSKVLLSIINDVLDMSSIESGKLLISKAPFNVSQLISSLTAVYFTQCKQKGVNFSTRLVNAVDEQLSGDSLRLNQILMNLLSNAVKFTDEGSVTMTIEQRIAQLDKLYLHITVSDTGSGMSEDMKARLFKPFEQGSASTAKEHGGSGLGLAIVKNLVTLMGGAIDMQSELGKGTTFTVDLPFDRCEQTAISPDEALSNLRVLAVDDEKDTLEYVSSVLTKIGVAHDLASSGEEALLLMQKAEQDKKPYNVCLIDWKMPGLSGIETTVKIRAEFGRETVVIIASAYDYSIISEQAASVGVDRFISKPLFPSAVYDMLLSLPVVAKKSLPSDVPGYSLGGKRVLLAEDNDLNRIVAVGYLKKAGVSCDIAEDGKIAVEKFLAAAPGRYDAILMDMEMPVLDGIEATKAIRASEHPSAKTIPILAMTANAFTEDVARCLQSGMNDHIAKPLVLDVLLSTLHKAMNVGGKTND